MSIGAVDTSLSKCIVSCSSFQVNSVSCRVNRRIDSMWFARLGRNLAKQLTNPFIRCTPSASSGFGISKTAFVFSGSIFKLGCWICDPWMETRWCATSTCSGWARFPVLGISVIELLGCDRNPVGLLCWSSLSSALFRGKTKKYITLYLYGIEHCLCFVNQKCKLYIYIYICAHAHCCLQFEHSGNGLMSHIRETSKVTINTSYFHPAHQQYTDEAQMAVTVPSVVRYCSMAFWSYWALYRMSHCCLRIVRMLTACSLSTLAMVWCPTFVRHQR
jgi:hypothetical protein